MSGMCCCCVVFLKIASVLFSIVYSYMTVFRLPKYMYFGETKKKNSQDLIFSYVADVSACVGFFSKPQFLAAACTNEYPPISSHACI